MNGWVLPVLLVMFGANQQADSVKSENVIDTTEVFVAREQCTVLLFPDSSEAAKMAAELGDDAMNEVASDIAYYQFNCEQDMDARGIVVRSTDKGRLAFLSTHGQWFVDKNSVDGDVLLWNGRSAPVATSSVDYVTVVDSVFGRSK